MNRRMLPSVMLFSATGLLTLVAASIFLPANRSSQQNPAVNTGPSGTEATTPATPSEKKTPPKKADGNTAAGNRPSLPPAPRTVEDVVERFESIARKRYATACRRAKIAWPPKRLMLLAFKREKLLEVWAAGETGRYSRLATHKVLAASGGDGPKRKQGDEQVPEGFYDLTELNPNSAFHLSIRVDYPNSEDIGNSRISLQDMGGDIYIHGNQLSIGCLAMGDRTIEELFPLAALVPRGSRRIIIAPFDFRRHPNRALPREAAWVTKLYGRIETALREFPVR